MGGEWASLPLPVHLPHPALAGTGGLWEPGEEAFGDGFHLQL